MKPVDSYIKRALSEFPLELTAQNDTIPQTVQAQIIVVSYQEDDNLLEVIDSRLGKKLEAYTKDKLKSDVEGYKPTEIQKAQDELFLPGRSNPHKLGMIFGDPKGTRKLIVHRNGCTQYIEDIEYEKTGKSKDNSNASFISLPHLAVRLIQTLQFAGYVFSEDTFSNYNYSKEVKILVKLQSNNSVWGLRRKNGGGEKVKIFDSPDKEAVEGSSPAKYVYILSIERSPLSSDLGLKYNEISDPIMDEIYNCFGENCPPFEKNTKY